MRALFLSMVCAGLAVAAPAADAVATARGLATGGKRPEALELLEKRLAEEPADADARTLHGIILSWDGRYDEARRDLEAVLARHRDYGDALRALINVEMWSDHPERAEALARDALRRNPNDTALLLARAKALRALGQSREALATVRHLIDVDPGSQEAASQERDLGDSLRHWTASFDHSSEWFSDGRAPWREEQVQLSRQTGLGSVIARFSQADRFSIVSQQVEIDAYPHIRPGTYAYLNVGYSADAALYSRYHFGAELYQSLGHGWEGSAGFRQMHFSSNVNIYTPSLTKYYGNWMFTGRMFLTPGSAGASRSAGFQVRRYYGDGTDYWGLRYGHGSSPAETLGIYDPQILNSTSLTFEFQRAMSRRLSLQCRWGVSREDRVSASGLRHYLAETSIYYRL
ncbi:MAG TPA: YaiO family outer membrane beta-barrel protein [Bryobacteraceae bacterium]|nr:YaiO family outer membrane beta-barrel protein [Bryobacteraceae bacterium]